MSEEDIRRIAREENKPFLDRIMELQDTLKDREEYCNKLEEDRENILIENKKQKEVLDKIKEKGVMYYDPEYSKIYGELCSMPGANNTRTPVIVIDDEILELLEEIE